MAEVKVSDQLVRRVLTCLADCKRRSLKEVTEVYNQRYPPGLKLFKRGQKDIKSILDVLVVRDLVLGEVFTFTNEPIPPTKFYVLTGGGFRALNQHR